LSLRRDLIRAWLIAAACAETPDGDTFLSLCYGPNIGGSNHARFNLQAFNALYLQRQQQAVAK
jgi:hypothetical protein